MVPSMDIAHVLLYTAICFAVTVPWFIVFYPGIMEIDTVFQIAEYLGYGYGGGEPGTYTNLYPLLDVWIFGATHDFMMGISNGDPRAAAAGMCVLIMLGVSLSISLGSCYLQKWDVPVPLRFIPLVIYAFVPAFSLMAIDIGKDTLFCSVFVPFCICCFEAVRASKDGTPYGAGWIVGLMLSSIFASLTASKGFIIVLLVSLACLIYAIVKKSRSIAGIAGSLGTTVVLFATFAILIVPTFVPDNSSTTLRELLGTPVQQVSFAVKTGTELTEEENKQVNGFFDLAKAVNEYDPAISDKTKNHVNLSAGVPEAIEFMKAYFSIGGRAGTAYQQAFADLYDGYYEVGTYNAALLPRFMPTWQAFEEYGWTSQDNLPNNMETMRKALREGNLIYSFTNLPEYQDNYPDYAEWGMYTDGEETRIAAFEYVMNWASIPVLCLLVDKSLYVLYLPLLLLIGVLLFGWYNRGPLLVCLIPLIISCLVAFASPIDFSRYVYPCMMLILFLVPMVLANVSITRE